MKDHNKITGSQVADNGGTISKSKNKNNKNKILKKVRKESALISFVVGVLTSLLSSYIYDTFIR